MSEPVRTQLRRAKGWRMTENTVKVDRATKWGNVFIVGVDGTREDCVRLFRALLAGLVCLTCKADVTVQRAYLYMALDNIDELRGKNLGCWCSLPKPGAIDLCHGAVLLEAAASDFGSPKEGAP